MTSKELAEYTDRLEATGLHFARGVSHDGGANLGHLEDIPWSAAILRIIGQTGWRITDGPVEPPTPADWPRLL